MKKIHIVLTFLIWAAGLTTVDAQSNNRSDFNVPPPLSPGSTTKGNATGKTIDGKQIILKLSNIPSFGLPEFSPVQLPELAAIGTSAPPVDQPDQPALTPSTGGLPELPFPATPETPAMPGRTLQDSYFSLVKELPIPAAPDLPEFPKEPLATANQSAAQKANFPALPGVISAIGISLPLEMISMSWPTPGIPDHTVFKLLLPKSVKAMPPKNQGSKKVNGGTSGNR